MTAVKVAFNYYLLIKHKSKVDSLFIDKDENEYNSDTCIISAKQLDGIGHPEIIIDCRRTFVMYNRMGNYSFSFMQIWNPDSKQKIFDVKYFESSWSYDKSAAMSAEKILNDTTLDDSLQKVMINDLPNPESSCYYKCEISFTKNGSIVIKNADLQNDSNLCDTDKKEGTYSLVNGVYILKEENTGK
ncbi:MAG: hypothetical protein HY064_13655 [Bacteroidetes bacterium]|nr:hypothetical protein [Bacteroidota bacterium]